MDLDETEAEAGMKEATATLCVAVLCVYWKPNTRLRTNCQESCNGNATCELRLLGDHIFTSLMSPFSI